MSDIQTCLAAFAVASWSNNDVGREMADKAIDAYLAGFPTSEHRPALTALRTAYDGLQLDSHVAVEIVARLDNRILDLPQRRPHGGPSNDLSPLA